MMKTFLNWKLLAGLGVIAAGVLLFAPRLLAAALPLVLLAACPLAMLLMMRGMGGMQKGQSSKPAPPEAGRTRLRGEQVAQLRGQLADVDAQQAALAEEIRVLKGAEPAPPPAPGTALDDRRGGA